MLGDGEEVEVVEDVNEGILAESEVVPEVISVLLEDTEGPVLYFPPGTGPEDEIGNIAAVEVELVMKVPQLVTIPFGRLPAILSQLMRGAPSLFCKGMFIIQRQQRDDGICPGIPIHSCMASGAVLPTMDCTARPHPLETANKMDPPSDEMPFV